MVSLSLYVFQVSCIIVGKSIQLPRYLIFCAVRTANVVPGPPENCAVVVDELSSEVQCPAGAGYVVGRC